MNWGVKGDNSLLTRTGWTVDLLINLLYYTHLVNRVEGLRGPIHGTFTLVGGGETEERRETRSEWRETEGCGLGT